MKFNIGTFVIVVDPNDWFFPGHKFNGRVGKIISNYSSYIQIEFDRIRTDKFHGVRVVIPYIINSNQDEFSVIPLDMNNSLIKLVCNDKI